MKRSHAIALGATGIILAGAWLGRAGNQRVSSDIPDPGTDAQVFASIEECLAARRGFAIPKIVDGRIVDTKSEGQLACEADFKAASETHVTTAPKFSSAGDCEAQYGASQCKPASFNGASVFVPAMVGFMVANHLIGQRQPQALLPPQNGVPLCPPGQTPQTQPGCVAPRTASSSSGSSYGSGWRSYSTSSGHTVSRPDAAGSSTVKVPTAAAAVPAARSSLGAVAAKSSAIGNSSTGRSAGSSGTPSRGGFGSTASSRSSSSSS